MAPNAEPLRSQAEILAAQPEHVRSQLLGGYNEARLAALNWDWKFWARPNQLAPDGDWTTWLVLAGRGFGKTRTGAEWVRAGVCGTTPLGRGRWRQVALIAETAADGRDVMVGDDKAAGEGSGVLQVHPKDFRPSYIPSKRRLEWPNGAVAYLYNATEPDQLRGPQHDAAWGDEFAKWEHAEETLAQLRFGLRLGTDPRLLLTTTPKPIKALRTVLQEPGTVAVRGSTFDNRSNLAQSFLRTILDQYDGTRLGRQELYAHILDDVVGALWDRDTIDALRVRDVPPLRRVVIAVDPAVTNKANSDETGIIAAGLGTDGHGYLLRDVSGKYSPNEWAKIAIDLYLELKADRVVAEVNQGGDMVVNTIRTVNPRIPVKPIHVWRGKARRMEPVAALYEQKRTHHVGSFPALEDQMCLMTTDFEARSAGFSPDRVDAAVMALSELMIKPEPTKARRFHLAHSSR